MSNQRRRLRDQLTSRQRLALLTATAAVIVITGAALFTVPDPDPGTPGPGARTSQTVPAGWQPAAARFARAYERYLTGRAPARRLPATARARMIAASGGPIPARMRDGPSVLSAVSALAAPGEAVRATFTVRDASNTYPVEIALAARNGSWQVVDLIPPDFATIGAPPAPPPRPAVADLQRAAGVFARRYLRYVSGDRGSWPARSPTLRRQIRSGDDPLARTTADLSAAKITLRYGPRQGDTITVTATVDAAVETEFSFVMRKSGGRWRAYAFVTDGGG